MDLAAAIGERPKTMKIIVNGRFEGRLLSGVDRYAIEVTGCLDGQVRLERPRRRVSGPIGHTWEQLVLPRRVHRDELLWSPANSGPVAVSRQVVTIHDLSVLEHPEWFSRGFHVWYRIMLPLLASRVRHILTVSECSRQSIMRILRVPPHKVTAVPNGVNLEFFRRCDPAVVRRKYGLAGQYVLFVGSIDPRKNLPRLLRAWDGVNKPSGMELVIAGGRSRVFRSVTTEAEFGQVRQLGYVPDGDLPGLYSGATFFVMPSLFEGFGLTTLEAMACGTPVVASTGGALSEVADGAALPVRPNSVQQMRQAMQQMLSDDCLRRDLSEKGLRRASEFPWERTARQIGRILSENA